MPISETHARWENFYRERPVWAIGWLEHPDDWLRKLITDGTIRKGSALDLGCGAGDKSVYLAKNGFSVTGVDISPTALREAKALAQKVGTTVEFLMADATNLVILKKPFSFVLDFSTFHIIPEDERADYLNEVFRLTETKSQLFLHVFSKRDPNHTLGFFRSDTTKEITYTFDKTDIDRLFGSNFKIIAAQPADFTINDKKLYFDEYLMVRK